MKKILPCLSLLLFCVFFISSSDKSVIDRSLDVVDKKLSVINRDNDILDDNLSIVDDKLSVIDPKKSVINRDLNVIHTSKDGIGIYEKTVINTTENVVQNTVHTVVIDVSEDPFVGNYGKFLSTVTKKNPQARHRFVQYFADWQRTNQNQDFFAYAGSRAEREQKVEACYDAALAKFGTGTAIMATTWIVAYILPGGSVYQVAYIIIAKATTEGAIAGGAIGGIISAGMSLLEGKDGEELIFDAINDAAECYVIGAITGLVKGSADAYKYLKSVKEVQSVKGIKTIIDGDVYSAKGTRLTSRLEKDYDPVSAEQYFKNVASSEKYLQSQSKRTRRIIADYTKQGADYGYETLNGCLRGIIPCDYIAKFRNKVLQNITQGHKNPAQTFFRFAKDNLCGFELQEVNGKLYRTVNGRLRPLKGKFLEKGFLSVSSSPTPTSSVFLEGAKKVPYRLIIKSPNGNPGVFVGDRMFGSQFTAFNEFETIKPAGTAMNIKRYEWNKKLKVWDIFAEEIL